MVTITITAKRGNHARSFAHLGYLGLSPVIVSGAVSTRIEEDGQALAAYKVLIRLRCYEGLGHHPGQGAGLNTDLASSTPSSSSSFKPSKINILWQTEKVLWTPSDDNLLGDDGSGWLGDTDTPWRLVIPPSAVQIKKGGHAVGSMTYRDWGTWWQIEAGTFISLSLLLSSFVFVILFTELDESYLSHIAHPVLSLCSAISPPVHRLQSYHTNPMVSMARRLSRLMPSIFPITLDAWILFIRHYFRATPLGLLTRSPLLHMSPVATRFLSPLPSLI